MEYKQEFFEGQKGVAPPAADFKNHIHGDGEDIVEGDVYKLQRGLSGIHTSMIAIGGAIGAGLFVSAGGAFAQGGPAGVFIGFIIISCMMICVMQALGELATLYPQNGSFIAHIIRFVDPSWGFAMGLIYAVSWLTVLPFELTAAGLTIDYWNPNINIGVWITVFLVAMFIIQAFGVRAYGWSEVFLSMIKVTALIGFSIYAIIANVGGVKSDPEHRGYIGFDYWKGGLAFADSGFFGFCGVFVTAAFAFGGTELVGLAAAETVNPEKQLPKAIRQTVWRIIIFYVLSLFLVGLIVPSTNEHLLDANSGQTAYSIFVIAFTSFGVKVLPSIFNVVITMSVISVANSCTYGSTRSLQALAGYRMLPNVLAYVDKKGRPIPTILLQLAFAMLAFINETPHIGTNFFNWLLSLTAIAYFFVWGSICLAHIRFRMAWKANGKTVAELPYKAAYGVIGSYIGLLLNILALMASIYTFTGGPAGFVTISFIQGFLAIPCIAAFYLIWKVYSFFFRPEHRRMWTNISKIDIYEGMRRTQLEISGPNASPQVRRESIAHREEDRHLSMAQRAKQVVTTLF